MTSDDAPLLKINDIISEHRIAYEAGYRLALYVVFKYFRHLEIDLPDWVLDGITEELSVSLHVPKKISYSGPTPNDIKMLRNNKKHYERWLVYARLKSKGLKGAELNKKAIEIMAKQKDYVAIEAIKASYYAVEDAREDPKEAWKFFPSRLIYPDLYKQTYDPDS